MTATKSRSECGYRWQVRIGKIWQKHVCGEPRHHDTNHVCKKCGVTRER